MISHRAFIMHPSYFKVKDSILSWQRKSSTWQHAMVVLFLTASRKTFRNSPEERDKELIASIWPPNSPDLNLSENPWDVLEVWSTSQTTGPSGPAANALVPDTAEQASSLDGSNTSLVHGGVWLVLVSHFNVVVDLWSVDASAHTDTLCYLESFYFH